jgi:VanZ family protein
MKTLWLLFTLAIVSGAAFPFHFTRDRDIVSLHLAHISANPLRSGYTNGPVPAADAIENVVLFVPFGALAVLSTRPGPSRLRRVVLGTVLAGVLSASIETMQVFTRERIPSSTDVVTNTLGGLIGAVAASRTRGRV